MSNEMKYNIPGPITKKSDGEAIPEDEPVVLFRGKDKLLPSLLLHYLRLCITEESGTIHADMISKLVDRVVQWQHENPELCKIPDSEFSADDIGSLENIRSNGFKHKCCEVCNQPLSILEMQKQTPNSFCTVWIGCGCGMFGAKDIARAWESWERGKDEKKKSQYPQEHLKPMLSPNQLVEYTTRYGDVFVGVLHHEDPDDPEWWWLLPDSGWELKKICIHEMRRPSKP